MKRLLILVAVLGAVALAVGAGGIVYFKSRSDDVNLVTEAPALTSAGEEVVEIPQIGTLAFEIVPAESEVTYVAREKLQNLPASSNAVGKTSAITGTLYLTQDGLATDQQSSFTVDLRTITSDETRRDNYMKQTTLQTNQYPNAVYVIESVEGFPSNYVEGEEIDLTINGQMTIKGTTKPLTFTAKARQAGNKLSAVANTDFNMTYFNVQPPDMPFVTVEDHLQLQVVIIAELKQAES